MITLFGVNINSFFLIAAVGVLFGAIILSRLYKNVISPFFVRLCDKTRRKYNNIIVESFSAPTTVMILFVGFFASLSLGFTAFNIVPPDIVHAVGDKAIRVAIIIYFTWGLFLAGDIFTEFIHNVGSKIDIQAGQMASKFLGYVFRFVILSISAVVLIGEFGYDVNGLLAGLGLGGLTFALAAQDSAANFFSGVVLIFEKPFQVGDWVVAGEIEGSVEEVTFRSTKIRALDGSINVIPNSKVTAEAIVSYTDLKNRYATHKIAINPNTPLESIKALVEDTEKRLKEYDDLLPDTVIVKITDFTTSGIIFWLAYSTHTADYSEFIAVRQQVNYIFLELVHRHGVELTVFRG